MSSAPTSSSRSSLTLWAVLSLALVAVLSWLVKVDVQALDEVDRAVGTGPEAWSRAHSGAVGVLHAIEFAFGTVPLTIYTIVTAVVLTLRSHRRAAVWTVGVMLGASLTTYFLKRFFQRGRPVWDDPISTLDSFSFPSGHASGIASAAGVGIVLTVMLVRRSGLRRLLISGLLLLALLVGADRIWLGVHNLSDVVAGYGVGAMWVLVGLIAVDPRPRPSAMPALTGAVPRSKRLAVILNPAKVESVADFRVLVEKRARETGWEAPVWHETTVEDTGRSMAEAAAITGADMVIVCGGDGTVRAVCGELGGTGISVGIVPAGTGNLLARNLGIPLYLAAAVDTALLGQDRAIDLVAVSGDGIGEGEHLLVMGGMGFDAALMEGANEKVKAKVGWLAYVVSGLRNLHFPAVRFDITIDGGTPTRHRARTVVVGNVGYLQAGIPLLPDASIDDGLVDVVIVHPRRFLSWVPVALRVISKNKRTDETLDRMTGQSVTVRAAHATPRQLDGDAIGAGTLMHVECQHGRLLVRVPR